MSHTRDKGDRGQALALAHLARSGYRLVAANVVLPFGEIDLIVEHADVRAYVEVKAGRDDPDFPPSVHFDRKKAERYRRLVGAHLEAHPTLLDVRVDLIAVSLDTGRIEHYEDVLG